MKMEIFAEIQNMRYKPCLCHELHEYERDHLDDALSGESNFILNIDNINKLAISKWVSPKRTRSYPFARVYDTLIFSGKRVTIIPIFKDEGADGDRDFLQWDTVSLMSLFNVHVIISFYNTAEKNIKYQNKITRQTFDKSHIEQEIQRLLSYQFSALHWNMSQLEKVYDLANHALDSYKKIGESVEVHMHSFASAQKKIEELREGHEQFKNNSRHLAQQAQNRESVTIQPKEFLSGEKAKITIKNFLGGAYFLTCDEYEIHDDKILLIEGKHTKDGLLPKLADIQDGLLKMAFC